MNDFIDPDPIPGPVQEPERPALQPIWPATTRRFEHLDRTGAVAYLDRLGRGEQMLPTQALEAAEASIGIDGGRQVVIDPRRGTPFVIVLHRGRHGLVYAQSWT